MRYTTYSVNGGHSEHVLRSLQVRGMFLLPSNALTILQMGLLVKLYGYSCILASTNLGSILSNPSL